jgi:hypothetical protein
MGEGNEMLECCWHELNGKSQSLQMTNSKVFDETIVDKDH